MIYVLKKNKIISCTISIMFVLLLFIIGANRSPNPDVEIIKVNSNNLIQNNYENYIKNKK